MSRSIPHRLLSPARLGDLALRNHAVMAPLTRSRATPDHRPTEAMAEYYRQRAGAGLIITEGTSPSVNGAGYARIPGLYSDAQVAGWRAVTDAVHAEGGRIFAQLMHTGRVSHLANLETGARVLAPSAVAMAGEIHTDVAGPQPYTPATAMSPAEIEVAIEEFVAAARNAVRAGFDGVEIHGANGYLVEQFLRPTSNRRDDGYGGPVAGRMKFLTEIVRRSGAAIGAERVGVRLSPYGLFNAMENYPAMHDDYVTIAEALAKLGVVYLHVLDHSAMGTPPVPTEMKAAIRRAFPRTLIAAGGYDAESAEAELGRGYADLVAFGRPFIANPDLVERFRRGLPLAAPDPATFYTPGVKGYTDYPAAAPG